MDRKVMFLSNPKNSNFVNNGSNNINITGNKNIINNTTNIYNEKPKSKTTKEVYQHNEDIHISTEQQQIIREKVNKIVELYEGLKEAPKYGFIYSGLNKKFKTPKYSLIKIIDFNEALRYLDIQFHKERKRLRNISATRFKEITIPLIWAKWHYVRQGEDLLEFINEKFNRNIKSLNVLSANDIDTLYTKVYTLKKRKYII